jgi:hypothetical protein
VHVDWLGRYRLAGPALDHDGVHAPGLVLGFGNVTEQRIRRGIRTLAEVVWS